MKLLTIILLFVSVSIYAQDSIYYDLPGNYSIGNYTSVKYKSGVTGTQQKRLLKKGTWVLFDSLDQVLKIENYSPDKSKQSSIKHGFEIYIDPLYGDTVLLRTYHKGKLNKEQAYKAAIIVEKKKVIHIYQDFDYFSIVEYPRNQPSRTKQNTITTWRNIIDDPSLIQSLRSYIEYEDSIGDESLMIPALYPTSSRFNHLSNPELEQHAKVSSSIMSFSNQIDHWAVFTGSPDFYISPGYAHSGTAFLGFRVFSMERHIEYVQNILKKPLQKDSLYCFSAYLKLAPGSRYATNAFGIKFRDKSSPVDIATFIKSGPDISLNNQLLNYKTRWMKVQCLYRAKGGENYMVLGSFKDHRSLQLKEVPGNSDECYYYLDDLCLVPVKSASDCPCNFSDQRIPKTDSNTTKPADPEMEELYKLKAGEEMVLKNIHFENDKDQLLAGSFPSLNNVLQLMQESPTMLVEISGHTSNTGSYEHNMDLSRRRADAVRNFLTINGIGSYRIITKGYGPNKPIADNESERGQHLNRRVAFKVLAL